jgi:hypothetical protein
MRSLLLSVIFFTTGVEAFSQDTIAFDGYVIQFVDWGTGRSLKKHNRKEHRNKNNFIIDYEVRTFFLDKRQFSQNEGALKNINIEELMQSDTSYVLYRPGPVMDQIYNYCLSRHDNLTTPVQSLPLVNLRKTRNHLFSKRMMYSVYRAKGEFLTFDIDECTSSLLEKQLHERTHVKTIAIPIVYQITESL